VALLTVCVVATAPPLGAQQAASGEAATPEQVAARFFDALAGHRWDAAAARVHPETLALFEFRLFSVLDADTTGRFAAASFGVADGAALRERGAERLFADLLAAVNRDTPALIAILATNAYRPVGHVAEEPDLAHAVLRMTPYTSGSAPTRPVLMTLRRSDGDWRILESDVLDALSTAITGLALSARAPAP